MNAAAWFLAGLAVPLVGVLVAEFWIRLRDGSEPIDLDDIDSRHRGITPIPADEQYAEMTWQRADGTTEVRRYKAIPDDEQSP